MYILHVSYDVKPGKRKAFLAKLSELEVAEKSRAETGNIDYSYYLPTVGDDKIFLLEVWESVEAQTLHTTTEHFKALAAIKDDYVDCTSIKKYDGALEI